MNILNIWLVNFLLYLFFCVSYAQLFKYVTTKAKNVGILTSLLQIIAGLVILVFLPFFDFKLPTNPVIYLLLTVVMICYVIEFRLNASVRRELEISNFTVLSQTNTVFMIIFGLIFYKEPFVITKILGALLIIFSNIMIFYEKGKFTFNKYVLLGVISNLAMATAVSLDISVSPNFNLPFYISITFIVPAIIILFYERAKLSDLKLELSQNKKSLLLLTGIFWSLAGITSLRNYLLGDITMVAPLCTLTVILNVICGYIFLKERKNLVRKLIAAILIVFSVVLINL